MNTMKFGSLLLLALQQFHSSAGFSTPVAPAGCGGQLTQPNLRSSNCANASFNGSQLLPLHQLGRQRRGSVGLRMSDGGEAAAAAVPPANRGFIEKVNISKLSVSFLWCRYPNLIFLNTAITSQYFYQHQHRQQHEFYSSNPKSHLPPNAKNSYRSAPCSSLFSSTTLSYAIPKMCSWSLPKSREPRSFPSSRPTSIYPRPLDSPHCTASYAIRWNSVMSSTPAPYHF